MDMTEIKILAALVERMKRMGAAELYDALTVEYAGLLSAGETIFDGTNTWDWAMVVARASEREEHIIAQRNIATAIATGNQQQVIDAAACLNGLLMDAAQAIAMESAHAAVKSAKGIQ